MINYNDTINLLKSKDKFYINLGLDRMKQILDLYGNPQEKISCIQIAGTNGKGSVAAILETILRHAGYKTGLYTSPHIFDYTERIKISGVDILQEDFANYTSDVIKLAEGHNIHLTEFEILTTVMFRYFSDKNIDVAILETGLGGRLDATNIVSKNLCSIITHIDLDHTDRLGDTKEKIAFEKAGIIKPNCPVITCEGYEIIKEQADKNNSLMILTSPFANKELLSKLSLKGTFQRENLALVLSAIEILYKDIPENVIIDALQNVRHNFRFQYIKDKNLLIDGAHNPNGIKLLNDNLNLYFPNTKRRFVFGCLNTKDYKKMVDILFSFSEYGDEQPEIYFYQFNNPNACTFEQLQEHCVYFAKHYEKGSSINFSEDVLTIFCGSLYMISELVDKTWL